jgi:hypothetical protein
MSVCCECCVLSGRGLCDGLVTRPEESYRMWCVWVWSWSLEKWGGLGPPKGFWAIEKKIMARLIFNWYHRTCDFIYEVSHKPISLKPGSTVCTCWGHMMFNTICQAVPTTTSTVKGSHTHLNEDKHSQVRCLQTQRYIIEPYVREAVF